MTDPQIEYSDDAQADLLALMRYIADRDGKLRAEMVVGKIRGTIRTLAFMPGMGRQRPDIEPGARAFPATPWMIFYVPLPELDGIRVVRVIDGRRDLESLFGP